MDNPMVIKRLLLSWLAISIAGESVGANDRRFMATIAPVLARRCLDCHNESTKEGGLDLTSLQSALKGGDNGPAIVSGKPTQSRLWQRIRDNEMPPDGVLPSSEKEQLQSWIADGAPWGPNRIDRFDYTTDSRAGYDWWSLQPLDRPRPPTLGRQWSRNPIDSFILQKLDANGLSPSEEANREVLVCRLSFDLTGLPPEISDVAEFSADRVPGAYERLVDRLLDSPHYGERWGRHWLDLARFGESQGFERDKLREHAWRYRDWVVSSLNLDMPYDKFARLQLAGDVYSPDDADSVIATGFLVAGAYDEVGQTQQSEAMRAVVRQDELEDYVGLIGQTFLGLTINCARCHDHKFDPITQTEYYRLTASLAGVRPKERDIASPRLVDHSESWASAVQMTIDSLSRRVQEIEEPARQAVLASRPSTGGQESDSPQSSARGNCEVDTRDENCGTQISDEEIRAQLSDDETQEYRHLKFEHDQLQEQLQRVRTRRTYAVAAEAPKPTFFLNRGNTTQKGDIVTPGAVAAVMGPRADFGLAADAPDQDRRAKLADWVCDSQNALFARVIVNRIWHYHFGVGLVDTPNDFGFNGGRPTHPQLIDWLATELIRNDWNLKAIQRLIVNSATYRQSSRLRLEAYKVDAENRLLWRTTPRRLDAEQLRDAILAVSGELISTVGGPGFYDFTTYVHNTQFYEMVDPVGYSFNRRSLYRTWVRSGRNSLLDVFDCPDPSTKTPRRAITTTPLQALSLMNNAFLLRMCESLANRVSSEVGEDLEQQVKHVYELVYRRHPTDDEQQRAHSFAREHGLPALGRVLFNSNEFLYVD